MLLSILATAGASLVLYVTGFFSILTPLPFIVAFLKRGIVTALSASVLALAGIYTLYHIPGQAVSYLPLMIFHSYWSLETVARLSTLYFFYYLCAAWAINLATRYRRVGASLESSYAWMTGATIFMPGLLLLAGVFFFSGKASFGVSSTLLYLFEKIISLQEAAQGTSGQPVSEGFLQLKQQLPFLAERMAALLPALWVSYTIVVLSSNFLLARRWLGKEALALWPDFVLWRLKEGWIWAPIGVGGLYFLNAYVVHSKMLGVLSLNALIVLAVIYFLQGLAVTAFFFRRKFSAGMRLLAYGVIFLFVQVVGVFVVSLGLFDFWFDFRKLKKLGR